MPLSLNQFPSSLYFPVLTFFFFGSTFLSSSLPAPSASTISSSLPLPLLSCAESYSSATSLSESDWKSSSTLSSSSSAEPRSARAATTSSSEESMLASLRAAWIRAEDWWGSLLVGKFHEDAEWTYVVEHFVAGLEAFGCEEIF